MAATMYVLPTADDLGPIERALQDAFDKLERVGWAVKAADNTDSPDYPHPVSFETMGVLAEIRAVLDLKISSFREISSLIDDAMFALSAIRYDQDARRNGGVDA